VFCTAKDNASTPGQGCDETQRLPPDPRRPSELASAAIRRTALDLQWLIVRIVQRPARGSVKIEYVDAPVAEIPDQQSTG